MRIWNLNEPINLAEDVVTVRVSRPRRRVPFRGSRPMTIKLFAGVASLAVTLALGTAVVNRDVVRLPNWATAVSKSVSDLHGPLDLMFRDRFSAQWTDALETSLLNEIVENRLLVDRSQPGPTQVARFIFSNQQESMTLETPRLSRVVIERIVKERRIS